MEENLWIVESLAGDVNAFGRLVGKYQTAVYNLAYRMLGRQTDAEDAAQETFVRAYTKLSSYDPQLSFRNWLLAIAGHLCIDQLRRKQADSLDEEMCLGLPDTRAISPEAEAIKKEQESDIRALLESLPEKYRMMIVLRYWYDMPYSEIGQITGLEETTVKTRLFRARQMLIEQVHAQPGLLPRFSAVAA
jgi:RNA polymerase sigma-70 factor (ECF subfamily)